MIFKFESNRIRSRRIFSIIFIINADDAGKPIYIKRIIYRINIFSFKFKRIWVDSWLLKLNYILLNRFIIIDRGTLNARAAARMLIYYYKFKAYKQALIFDFNNIKLFRCEAAIVEKNRKNDEDRNVRWPSFGGGRADRQTR